MSNRFQIQFSSKAEVPRYSPVIYGHGGNEDAPAILCRLRDQMEPVCGRGDELSLVAARCVQQLIGDDPGTTGVRITNEPSALSADRFIDGAEVFIVELGERWSVRQIGGIDEQPPQYPTHQKIDWSYEVPSTEMSLNP